MFMSRSSFLRGTGVLVFAIAVAAFIVSAKSRTTEPATSTVDSQARIESEVFTLRPTGFEPSQITRPTGAFVLAVDNRSGLEEIRLRLDREDGSRADQISIPGKKLDWREVVNLSPGNYLLREVNHSDWLCRITITAQ